MGCLKSKSKSKKIQTDAEAQAESLETPSVFERLRSDFGQGEPKNAQQNVDHKLVHSGWFWNSDSATDENVHETTNEKVEDKDKKTTLKVKTKENLLSFTCQKHPMASDLPKTGPGNAKGNGHDFLWIDSHFEFGVRNKQHFWTILFGDLDHEAGVGITRRNKLKESGSNGIFFQNGLILANSRMVVHDYGPKIRAHDKVQILLAFSHKHQKENHEHDHDHEEKEEKQESEKEDEENSENKLRLRLYFFLNNISLGLACDLEVPGPGQGPEFRFTHPGFGGFHPAVRFFGHSGSASILKEPLDHLPPSEQLLRFQEKGIVGEWRMNNHGVFFSNKHNHSRMHEYRHPDSDPVVLVIERSSVEKTDFEYKMDIQFHRNSIGQTEHIKFNVKKLFMHSKWQGENWKNGDALRVKRKVSFHHHHKKEKEEETDEHEHIHRPSWEQEQFEAELTKLCHNPDTVECKGDVLEIGRESGKTIAIFHRIHRHPKPFVGELPGEIPFQ